MEDSKEAEGKVQTWLETDFGPCALGRAESAAAASMTPLPLLVTLLSNRDLDRICNRYFSLELIGIRKHKDDEKRAEEYEDQRQLAEKAYVEDGVWVTPILFKPDPKKFRKNYSLALKRFLNMEKRLSLDPQLEKDYKKEIQDLFDRGDGR
jgi:hypothetical protein